MNFLRKTRKFFLYLYFFLCFLYVGFRNGFLKKVLSHLWLTLRLHLEQFERSMGNEGHELTSFDTETMKKWQQAACGLHALLPENPLFAHAILIPVISKIDPKCEITTGPKLKILNAHINEEDLIFESAMGNEVFELASLDIEAMKNWQQTAHGLHALLPENPLFTYSILIPVASKIDPKLFEITLTSALSQTAPKLEILIGYRNEEELINEYAKKYPHLIKTFHIEGGTESTILNYLAEKAAYHFLFLLNPSDRIRPDLLLRYEQTLRLFTYPAQTVLFCYDFQISKENQPIPSSLARKKATLHFPYQLTDEIHHGLLIPKELWTKAGGVKQKEKQIAYYDLLLRLDVLKATFHCVPCILYGYRQETALPSEASIQALQYYVKAKNLDWEISPGLLSDTYRAKPKLKSKPSIHAIVPFKDQKEITLKGIHSLMQQQNVTMKITTIDNNSKDASISQELQSLGIEVLHVTEPFNFSRLNNFAVKNSKHAQNEDSLLIINNDIELEPDAVEEMSRWIEQPKIGAVGCRLHYPNGVLQHGGVELHPYSPNWRMTWRHIEKMSVPSQMRRTKQLSITPAVTAACMLIKRSTFLSVGGFDEVWYPNAYSDTNLCMKLTKKGFFCFYTPYAIGIHYESLSRKLHSKEDYESTYWLNDLYFETQFHSETI